jgi:tRNA(Arg) A34 adenosine deaminase TadA
MEQLSITIPPFVDELVAAAGPTDSDEARMRLAIALSLANVERGGSPFGAVVFDGSRVVAAGVNRVLDSGLSIAHAEIVTLMRAQKVLNSGPQRSSGALTLVSSTEPCCQCYGAVVWSGVSRLVCGASTADAEAIGFDEGPKPEAWVAELERRGISVTEGICRSDARAVLEEYARRSGPIYGVRQPSDPAK